MENVLENSDKNITLEELKILVQAFCEERAWDPHHGPKDLAIGLVTEASELLEIFRFVNEKACYDLVKDPKQKVNIADELADSLYFILRFAQMYNFDLTNALQEKLKKNVSRYPPLKKI